MERGEIDQPSIRMLANCALVLDLLDDEWRKWCVFDAGTAPRPPLPWIERAMRLRRSP